ncbi:MAG: hypothetical protein Q8P81_03955 [Nanoarchaeota archaeon]|nr:hypothetical protein [Nanoarchaeota archaeon]
MRQTIGTVLAETIGSTMVVGTAFYLGTSNPNKTEETSETDKTYLTNCQTFQGYTGVSGGSIDLARNYALDSLTLPERNERGIPHPEIEVLGDPRILTRDNLTRGKSYIFEIGINSRGKRRLVKAMPCVK